MTDYLPTDTPPVVPYLAVSDGDAALDFYQRAFGAETQGDVLRMPDGKIGHATLKIGPGAIMISDAFPDMGVPSPTDLGGTTVSISIYVPDCDAATKQAIDAGAELEMPPQDQFWGNRDSRVKDPFGHRWNLATRTEDLTPEEISARGAEWAARMAEGAG